MSSSTLDRTSVLRQDFPILQRTVANGKPLVYLDNAATSQKPTAVLEAMDDYYRRTNANVHRGVHTLSEEATAAYEGAREKVARFINAPAAAGDLHPRHHRKHQPGGLCLGPRQLGPGDEVLITEMEHHANIVPWQILQEQLGFTLRYVPVTDQGTLDLDKLDGLLTERTKIFCFVHASNVVGTINPVDYLVKKARSVGAKVLIDGAQSAPHMAVDMQALDADFFAFSSHKLCGPTGIGVLYGKRELLEAMPPFMGGGDMIREVKLQRQQVEQRALQVRGRHALHRRGDRPGRGGGLLAAGRHGLDSGPRDRADGLRLRPAERGGRAADPGPGPEQRGGLIAFTLDGVHPHDIAAILDREGVAVRAGHHCAQPLHERYDIPASARASFYLYNTLAEVDVLAEALHQAQEIFAL